jgi:hypothetical protein
VPTLVIIRGQVHPNRLKNGRSRFASLFGPGRWKIEYTVRNDIGEHVDMGSSKAERDGRFALTVEARPPGTVEVRVKGGAAYLDDYCTVELFSKDDVVHLPRRLYPK